jgi:hypothetical protein
MNNFIVVV